MRTISLRSAQLDHANQIELAGAKARSEAMNECEREMEVSERTLRKTRILAMNSAKWLQT